MNSPCEKETGSEINSHWLDILLAIIVGLVAWDGYDAMVGKAHAGKFILFCACLLLYWAQIELRVVNTWFKQRDYRGYFLLSFSIISLAVYLGGAQVAIWSLAMPVTSIALFYLPLRQIAPVVVALFIISLYPDKWYKLQQLISITCGFLFTCIFSWIIRRERDNRVALQAAHEKLREFSAKAEALAAAEERTRLAREIHDGVAHHLTSANILVEASFATLPIETSAQTRDSLQKAQGQIRSALAEIRNSISDRRDSAAQIPLEDRIQQLIHACNFPSTFQLLGATRRLAPEVEQGLYRVAQEALTNAAKHAPGAAITLTLDFSFPDRARLRVENAELTQSPSGDGAFGLLSLRERIQHLGGNFSANSTPAGQFVVQAEIPV